MLARDYAMLQAICPDREKRLEYEAREKAIRDYNQGLKEAYEEGLKEGKVIAIAQKLLSMGFSVEETASLTELPVKLIQDYAVKAENSTC